MLHNNKITLDATGVGRIRFSFPLKTAVIYNPGTSAIYVNWNSDDLNDNFPVPAGSSLEITEHDTADKDIVQLAFTNGTANAQFYISYSLWNPLLYNDTIRS